MILRDYEKLIIEELHDDEAFTKFLKEQKNKIQLDENVENHIANPVVEINNLELGALEYLEEIAKVEFNSNVDINSENFIENKLFIPAKLSMFFLKNGVSYLDLNQEGTIALIEAHKNFEKSGYKDFDTYAKLIVGRAIVLHIYKEFMEQKFEFITYFKNKAEEYEEKEDLKKEFEKMLSQLEKLKYEMLENILLKNELQLMINYYGLGLELRDLTLPKENGEEIFSSAMNKLSKTGGEFFKL